MGFSFVFLSVKVAQKWGIATVDPTVLATSNGHNASLNGKGSTSHGSEPSASPRLEAPVVLSVIFAAVGMGAALLMR